ncbi:ATP-binding protein [Pantoea brenneri]|jgi:K+-sensing histidine kinase KdpD|uniref:ATP-binding protein n=1 Tax=Pantoea brenneri TaxID=472694 RepID=UPI0024473320|nr:ATP-binding protein [Pantoea brenneri]MDH1089232.1 ATP-binding protein [Pantoea brenneri]
MINYSKQLKKEVKSRASIESLKNEIASLTENNQTLEELKHDLGRFISEILSLSEELSQLVSSTEKTGNQKAVELASTLTHTISMASSRIIYSDIELSQGTLENEARFTSVVYKKFDKARRVLMKRAKNKNIFIKLDGKSNFAIYAISAFDMIPFILLENAIKYSPSNSEVTVTFEESMSQDTKLEVSINSLGPFVSNEDIKKLTQRGFRSHNEKVKKTAGQGLGLYIAHNLCGIHNVKMNFSSSMSTKLDDVDYGPFNVKLTFK